MRIITSVSLFSCKHNNEGVLILRRLFVEYSINAKDLGTYEAWARAKFTERPDVEFLRSTAQVGLMLEIWTDLAMDPDQWLNIRKDPTSEEWSPLLDWIVGGPEKLRVWVFESLDS